jgi:integrase/recombinase XerC
VNESTSLPDTALVLPDEIEVYLRRLRDEKRYSPHTLAAYRCDYQALIAGLGGETITACRGSHVRRALTALHAKGRSARSLARTLSAWRGLFAELIRNKQRPDDPSATLRAPKAAKRLPDTLSPDAAGALVSAFATSSALVDVRDRAVFELTYSSGLRVSEVVGLNVGDVDLVAAEARVCGKGNKTRIVPIGRAAVAALVAWYDRRAGLAIDPTDPDALFVQPQGQRLSTSTVQRHIKQWAKAAGLDVDVHPHMLRHSFASHVLQSSQDLRAVQEMLGHVSIASTQVYTHLDFQHLAKVYDQAHPRAKRRSS